MGENGLAALSDGQAAAIGAVAVAAVTGMFGLFVALVTRPAKTAAQEAAKKAKVVAEAVGTPNGKGNVVQMNEQQLALLTRLAVDIADLSSMKTNEHNALRTELQTSRGETQAGLAGVSTKLGDVVDAMDHHGARIGRIEKHLALPDLPKEPA